MPTGMTLRSRFGHKRRGFEGLSPIIKEEQRKQFEKLAPKIIAAYEKRVSNWSTTSEYGRPPSRPGFSKRIVPGPEGRPISMFIHVTGTDHQRQTFALLDTEGRSGKTVVSSTLMKFKKNYFGKTAATDVYGRTRRRSGPWRSTYTIEQAPITPRGFSAAIMEEFKPQFMLAARRGWRAAASQITGRPQREF